MALDEPHDDDKKLEHDGLQWVVSGREEGMILGGMGVRIDFVEAWYGTGFMVSKAGEAAGCC